MTIILDEDSKHIIRLWLLGRARIEGIKHFRWCAFLSCSTAVITECEMGAIVDCTSPVIIDLLKLSDEGRKAILESMRWQVAKDGHEI